MSGFWATARAELARIFAIRGVVSVMILGPAIYSVFYPQPYLNEALRNVPVAIVDQDLTAASRDFARKLDATSDVAVAMTLPDTGSAEREVYARNISGIVLIPRHFERELLHGRPSPVALYSDASYFLIHQRVSGAVSAVARTVGSEVEAARLIGYGVDPSLAAAASDPMPLTLIPLFNPQGGYATYVLPAAFILILQQTLLMGVGLLGSIPGQAPPASNAARVGGKLAAYLAVEFVVGALFLVILPWVYGIPQLGTLAALLVMAIPFVIAVSALGMILAHIFRTPLAIQLAMAAVGLPFFFLAGFAWPSEAVPEPLHTLALLLPSSSAIQGIVRVSQLGADLPEVRSELTVLYLLAVSYTLIAIGLDILKERRAGSFTQAGPAPV